MKYIQHFQCIIPFNYCKCLSICCHRRAGLAKLGTHTSKHLAFPLPFLGNQLQTQLQPPDFRLRWLFQALVEVGCFPAIPRYPGLSSAWLQPGRCISAGVRALWEARAKRNASSLEKLPACFHSRQCRRSGLGPSSESQIKLI